MLEFNALWALINPVSPSVALLWSFFTVLSLEKGQETRGAKGPVNQSQLLLSFISEQNKIGESLTHQAFIYHVYLECVYPCVFLAAHT